MPSQVSNIDGGLATCGMDGVVRHWTEKGELVKTVPAHDGPVRGLVRIRQVAVTGGKDGRLKVWDWENSAWLFDLQDPLITVWKFVHADGRLAVASWDKNDRSQWRIQVWQLNQVHEAALEHINAK